MSREPMPLETIVDRAALARAADENLAVHFTWVQSRVPGMRAVVDPELVLTSCGWPCDTFNAVCRARLTPRDAAGRVRGTLRWFGADRLPFSWWLGPSDSPPDLGSILSDQGLDPAESELAMGADLTGLPEPEIPPGLVVRPVRTPEDLATFASLSAANWSPPDEYVVRFYAAAAPLLLGPRAPLRFFLGFLDGVPVATAEAAIGGGVVGLYNIATVPSARGRGIGTAMTVEPLRAAREAGLSVAVLQAAPAGVGVYRRVGFESFGEIREFKPPAGHVAPR